jgi:hypothetical protein
MSVQTVIAWSDVFTLDRLRAQGSDNRTAPTPDASRTGAGASAGGL